MPAPLRRVAAAVAFAYLVFALSYGLASFPGLHGDEAWVGLFALRLRQDGLFTPHAINWYTGSLYGWLVSRIFGLLEPGIFSLRVLGVAANAGAALIVATHFARRLGSVQSGAWLLMLAANPLFLLKSRVAWDFYALQNLLVAGLIVCLSDFLQRRRFTPGRVLGFLTVIQLGVQNHFIFASVPLSLWVLVAFHLARDRDWELLPLFHIATLSLAITVVFVVAKPALGVAAWQAHRGLALGAFALLPLSAAFAFAMSSTRWDGLTRSAVDRVRRSRLLSHILGGILVSGLALFGALHLVALVQIGSGVVIFERLASWQAPLWLSVLLHLWSLFLLGVFLLNARRLLQGPTDMTPYERLLVLWPLAYMAVFTAFRFTAQIRHYAILSFLVTAALSVLLPRIVASRRLFLVPAGLMVLALHVCLWRVLLLPQDRRPLELRLGWTTGTSAHFQRLEPLYSVLSTEGICDVRAADFFLDQPLRFYLATHPATCSPARTLAVDYCPNCSGPPFFSWRVIER
jgi:hypothetical protein